ncbi:alpha/beta hydrolase [Streptomyces sp. HNM0574]|uniref:alpha/beta hydrolase n=1 Tax=Streptomyces sp. HNM0574 TaxID=2714954 RepID=UPI00146CAE6E|nr:alpha/beta hydrolase [Streptomyces sp. HNM0574]NLU68081.1 alpha/beta hydrolase [Streptomyces sp. HNM0574]
MADSPPPSDPVLEPAARELAEATSPHPRIYEVPPEQGRNILAGLQTGEGVDKPAVDEEWVTVDAGAWGSVRVRIVRPSGVTGPLPVVLYLHGAGWVFGDEHTHDRLVRELAVGARAAAVFPVYDRAPEAKYPKQIEQNYAVGRWIVGEGAAHGLDAARIAVCGDSVGGNMSAVFALLAKERGDVPLRAQVLLYPVTDSDFDTPSYLRFDEGYFLTRDGMIWFWDQYTSDPQQLTEQYAAPLRTPVDQLRGLPPALVLTAEADVLRDEGEAYAAKLRQAGVDVTAVRVLGVVHDFLMLDSLRDCAGTAVARRITVDALRNALDS